VQYEGHPLRGCQRLEHDEERLAGGVGQRQMLLGMLAARHIGTGYQRLLAARAALAQHVEADPGDYGGQPATEVLHRLGIRATELQPCLLHGILRFARRPEHAVGHRTQARSILIEVCGKPVTLAHAEILARFGRTHGGMAYQYCSAGRISMAPPRRAAGIRAASAIAASMFCASSVR